MENNSGGGNKIYVVIIALLLLINGGGGYLLWKENKGKKDEIAQKEVLQKQFTEKTLQLDSLSLELDQFKGKNAELDSIIVAQQNQIEEQKKKIQAVLGSAGMNKKKLEEANKLIAEYQATIADMQTKIAELTKQNEQLSSQNQQLSTDLSAEKATTAQLTETNTVLSKKVELGSLLQLRNMEVLAIRKKANGKEVDVNRVKQAESLKISFETGDNKVLENGPLSLYIRVLNPKGETISVADQGSGTLKLTESGEVVQFSKKADFDWTQSNKKIVVYWSQNIQDAGTYKVEVYQTGYLVGKGEVALK